MRQPLSEMLVEVLTQRSGPLTVNQLLEKTQNRGLYLAVIILSLPFIIPVAIPGVSTVLGLTIAWISLRFALGARSPLPVFIGDRPVPSRLQDMLSGSGAQALRWMEKWVKPRASAWLQLLWVQRLHFLLISILGLLLALPFPPLPPFTNSLPCYSILLLCASLLERDGRMIWAGYGLVIFTLLYLGGVTYVMVEGGIAALMRLWAENREVLTG